MLSATCFVLADGIGAARRGVVCRLLLDALEMIFVKTPWVVIASFIMLLTWLSPGLSATFELSVQQVTPGIWALVGEKAAVADHDLAVAVLGVHPHVVVIPVRSLTRSSRRPSGQAPGW